MGCSSRIALLSALVLAASCGDESTGPSEAALVGVYGATELTTIANGRTTNWATQGGHVVLHLHVGWSTAGGLNVPDPLATINADLAGTWRIVGDSVELHTNAYTFLRGMRFGVQGTTLSGDRTVGVTRYRVMLTKQ